MKKTCMTCEDREKCTALCADMEAEVNQDHVPLRELTVPDIEFVVEVWPENVRRTYLTKTEAKIVKLSEKEFSPQEISHLLDITMDATYKHISRIRIKFNNS